jgi:CPA2 family monovalent cation:H+ antiporter-2
VLNRGARAIGKSLAMLRLAEVGAEVTTVRRGKKRIEVTPETVLQEGDIVVLRGATEGVARAEERLFV